MKDEKKKIKTNIFNEEEEKLLKNVIESYQKIK